MELQPTPQAKPSWPSTVRIFEDACREMHACPADIKGPSRTDYMALKRWMVMKILRDRGWSFGKIGKLTNRHYSSAIVGLQRLAEIPDPLALLKERGKKKAWKRRPKVAAGAPKPETVAKPKVPTVPRPVVVKPVIVIAPPPPPPVIKPSSPDFKPTVSFLERTRHQCSWPFETSGEFLCCGLPTNGGSFCQHHAKTAYSTADKASVRDLERGLRKYL